MLPVSRRRVLQAAVAGSVVGLAGCSSSCPDDGAPDPETYVAWNDDPVGNFQTPPQSGWPSPRFDPGNAGEAPDTTPPSESVAVYWQTNVPVENPADSRYEASTPTVVGDRVLVSGGRGVHALRFRDGTRVWHNADVTPARIPPTFDYDRETAPPVVGPDGTAFVGGENALTALDPADGEVRWQFDESGAFSVPAVAGGTVYAESAGELVAVDVRDGAEHWRTELDLDEAINLPATDGNVVVTSDGGRTHAFDADTGRFRWRTDLGAEFYPVVEDGTVFLGNYDGLHALDLETGETRWTFERGAGRAFSSPVVTDDTIYAVERPGEGPDATYALDRTDGEPTPRWCSYVGEGAVTAATGGRAFAIAPTADGGPGRTVSVVAFTRRFGEALWGFSPEGRVLPPAVVDGAVVVGDRDGRVTAVGEV